MEVHNDDTRLDSYMQSLVWRMQTCGCPYWDTLRMCLAFRHLPIEKKAYVFKYGIRLTAVGGGVSSTRLPLDLEKPPVTYCKWHLKDDEEGEGEEEADGGSEE